MLEIIVEVREGVLINHSFFQISKSLVLIDILRRLRGRILDADDRRLGRLSLALFSLCTLPTIERTLAIISWFMTLCCAELDRGSFS